MSCKVGHIDVGAPILRKSNLFWQLFHILIYLEQIPCPRQLLPEYMGFKQHGSTRGNYEAGAYNRA
jgi:hypothetical protein